VIATEHDKVSGVIDWLLLLYASGPIQHVQWGTDASGLEGIFLEVLFGNDNCKPQYHL
jgi:hypothetical protein